MLLNTRAVQPEYFDDLDRSSTELAEGYAALDRVNTLLEFSCPFRTLLPAWLGEARCRSLTLLDLGAGNGALGAALTGWAAKRGWDWRVTSLDLNIRALNLTTDGVKVAGSALALPFMENSFDVVIASSMTHHLCSEADVIQHFQEAWRVSRDAVFLSDLHRNPILFVALAIVLFALRVPAHFRGDGLLSVRRGWRVNEWRRFLTKANFKGQVSCVQGSRVVLKGRKTPVALPTAAPAINLASLHPSIAP